LSAQGTAGAAPGEEEGTMLRTKRAIGVFVIATLLVVGPAAFVGLAKGRHSGVSATSLEVVNVDPTDTVNNYGDTITFTVDTNATSYPFVALVCFQGEDMVYSKTVGIFPDYSWSQNFLLSSAWWSGGAADCTASVYYFTSNGRERTVASLAVPIAA
jgi:hypothetical protein